MYSIDKDEPLSVSAAAAAAVSFLLPASGFNNSTFSFFLSRPRGKDFSVTQFISSTYLRICQSLGCQIFLSPRRWIGAINAGCDYSHGSSLLLCLLPTVGGSFLLLVLHLYRTFVFKQTLLTLSFACIYPNAQVAVIA